MSDIALRDSRIEVARNARPPPMKVVARRARIADLHAVMAGGLSAHEIALRAQMAALLEVSATKPGNVSRHHDFGDTSFEDFLLSAAALGSALGALETLGVGRLIERASRETRRWVRVNTNLGIVLLFAPLACAAAGREGASLRARLARVLAGLTVDDARAAYAAIRVASPGGLGSAPEQDVSAEPTVTLREAMALAADRDAIAREYVTDYATTFETTVPALRRAREQASWPSAITKTFLTLLAARPDSLIARKAGIAAAEAVSREAAFILAGADPHGPGAQLLGHPARAPDAAREPGNAIARFDQRLRSAANRLNPGTTADLVAAAIFVVLLEDGASGDS